MLKFKIAIRNLTFISILYLIIIDKFWFLYCIKSTMLRRLSQRLILCLNQGSVNNYKIYFKLYISIELIKLCIIEVLKIIILKV